MKQKKSLICAKYYEKKTFELIEKTKKKKKEILWKKKSVKLTEKIEKKKSRIENLL